MGFLNNDGVIWAQFAEDRISFSRRQQLVFISRKLELHVEWFRQFAFGFGVKQFD